MCIAALFVVAQIGNKHKVHSLMDEYIKCGLPAQWNIIYMHNMDEPGRRYAKRKKPVTRDHGASDPVYVKHPA